MYNAELSLKRVALSNARLQRASDLVLLVRARMWAAVDLLEANPLPEMSSLDEEGKDDTQNPTS